MTHAVPAPCGRLKSHTRIQGHEGPQGLSEPQSEDLLALFLSTDMVLVASGCLAGAGIRTHKGPLL